MPPCEAPFPFLLIGLVPISLNTPLSDAPCTLSPEDFTGVMDTEGLLSCKLGLTFDDSLILPPSSLDNLLPPKGRFCALLPLLLLMVAPETPFFFELFLEVVVSLDILLEGTSVRRCSPAKGSLAVSAPTFPTGGLSAIFCVFLTIDCIALL